MSRPVRARVKLNPTQLRAALSQARYPAMVSGMGAGKSHALRRIFLGRVAQNYQHMARKTPAMYFAPTYDMVDNLIVPSLDRDLTDLGIPHEFRENRHLLWVRWRGQDCYTRMLSAENYDRYMGPEVPFMLGDELELAFRANAQKIGHMWLKLISRLRKRGATCTFNVASTPEGHGFLWDWWDQRPQKDAGAAVDYQLFRCSTYENQRNLPEGYIERLKRDYPGPMIEAYLHGEFRNLTAGAIYHAFDRDRHVTKGLRLVPGVPMELSFDFNVDPCTCVVSQYRDPDLVIVDCLQDRSKLGTEELCRRVLECYGAFLGPVLVYGDATGGAVDSTSAGKSDRAIIDGLIGRHFEARGYDTRWTRTNPWPPDRFAAVNAMLAADRVVIDEAAAGLIADFTRQTYKDGTRREDDQGGKVGHAAAAIGYRIFRDFKVGRTLDERLKGAAA